jgi:PAS domain S-box-containing protein
MTRERIFIVEDEGIVAADLESILNSLGYQVVGIASSGEEAVPKIEAAMPDLVLMDIRLKGHMDGIDTAEQIHARFNIPVTYLTAYADEGTLERAKPTMPYGYILKPFEEKELALYKHKMEAMMAKIEGWHATTLRSIPEAIVATDKLGRITFMNERAEAISGWKLQSIYAKGFEEVFPLRDSSSNPLPLNLSRILKDGQGVEPHEPALLCKPDGHNIPLLYRIAPIKDEEGFVSGLVIVLSDVLHEKTVPV